MIVAGLDIATRTGLAILDGDRLLHWEAHRPKGKTDPEIFHGFRIWLRPTLLAFGVERVAVEQPLRSNLTKKNDDGSEDAIVNMGTYLRLYGLRAHAMELCDAMGMDPVEVNQSTWRKAFLGNGRGDKDMALAQCKQLRWPVTSKDAAEACGVAFWLQGHLNIMSRAGELALGAA